MANPGKLRSDEWPGAFKLSEECSEVSPGAYEDSGWLQGPRSSQPS